MSTARYQRIPSSPTKSSSSSTNNSYINLTSRRSSSLETTPTTSPTSSSTTLFDSDASERGISQRHLPTYNSDPRFHQSKPSIYARAGLLIFIAVSFYIAFTMRADIFYAIIGQQEQRLKAENEKWVEWAGAQDSY